MPRWKKYHYYPLMLFDNLIINKLPSYHIGKWFVQLLDARLGNSFFRRVEILFPKGLLIGNNSNVGWFTLLDARGGIKIGDNVSIASYVKIITGSYDFNSPSYNAVFKPIIIKDNAWICTGVIILQAVESGKEFVIVAGPVVTKNVEDYEVVGVSPARVLG